MKTNSDTDFGANLRIFVAKALRQEKPATNSQIARFFEVVPSAAQRYVEGDRFPDIRKLIETSRSENLSLDWLFKGDGDADRDPFSFLDQEQRQVLESFVVGGKDFAQVVREVVRDGLTRRATEMLANSRYLSAKEIDQLRAIVGLVGVEEETTSTAAKRQPSA